MNDDLTFEHRSTVVSNQIKGNTTHGYRTLPLTPEAIHILRKAQELNPFRQFIFMPDNRIMTTDSFNRRLKKYCKEAGIEYRSSHKIRFFAASAAFDGENLATVSKLMGHSNVETTMHYLRNIHKGTDDVNTMSRLGLENPCAGIPVTVPDKNLKLNTKNILHQTAPNFSKKESSRKSLFTRLTTTLHQCRRPESNRYGYHYPQDFKSWASASSATAA